MMSAFKVLAGLRGLRGTAFDVFGYTHERKLERELVRQYMELVAAMLSSLGRDNLKIACDIAALPLAIRGYGHVKLANLAVVQARKAEMLHRFDPQTYPRPPAALGAGQLRGIPVVSA